MELLKLAWEFFVTGLFAVGGGLTTLPFFSTMAQKYDWFTQQELVDMIAVSESTPGAIGVNMATYAGLNAAGITGGLIATFFIILPSTLILFLIIPVLEKYRENPLVQGLFYGLRAVSAGLILSGGLSIILLALFEGGVVHFGNFLPLHFLLFAVFFILHLRFKKISPILIILFGMLSGILLKL